MTPAPFPGMRQYMRARNGHGGWYAPNGPWDPPGPPGLTGLDGFSDWLGSAPGMVVAGVVVGAGAVWAWKRLRKRRKG